jgi:hypothetical protein
MVRENSSRVVLQFLGPQLFPTTTLPMPAGSRLVEGSISAEPIRRYQRSWLEEEAAVWCRTRDRRT